MNKNLGESEDIKLIENTKGKSKKIVDWIKEHKIELSVGAFVLLGVGIAIGLKCRKQIRVPVSAAPRVPSIDYPAPVDINLSDNIPKTSSSPKAPHFRKEHLRNLTNKNASAEKMKQAAELGIDLLPRQTLVKEACINTNYEGEY